MPGVDPISMAVSTGLQGALEWRKSNIAPPEYRAPGLSQAGEQTLSNLTESAKESPEEIAKSRIENAQKVQQGAMENQPAQSERQMSALGMADPGNINAAINQRMQRNLQGQMGAMTSNLQNEAKLESADRLHQTANLAIQNQKMTNAISQAKLESLKFKIQARQGIISDILGAAGGAAGGAMGGSGGAKGGGGGGAGGGGTAMAGGEGAASAAGAIA